MSDRIILRPDAESDLAEAFHWYEEQRKGLGQDLLLSVEAALEQIRQTPALFPVVHGSIRRALIRRFPTGYSTWSKRTPWSCWRCFTPAVIRSIGKRALDVLPGMRISTTATGPPT